MPVLVIGLIVLGLVFLPGFWVRQVMARYSQPNDRYSVTGGQAARRLLDLHGLQHVGTEATNTGDHYSPDEKMVRLSAANYSGKSLTAITVAAHEVGHAVQDATGYPALHLRTRLVRWVGPIEKLGAVLLIGAPVIIAITRAPSAGGLMLLGGFLTLGAGVVVHLLTLPTEFDASFGRALPMLAEHDVLIPGDERHARRLLGAAAMTYVSASLMSLLNIARWLAILRR
ncbi:MAG: zinc metallopeptidase [Pseudomonadota bacterium]